MPFTLHSALTPAAAVDALRRTVDPRRRTLFSLTGYRGSLSILGDISETGFCLQKRRLWRNDFAPHLYGQIKPESGGSRIEVHSDFSRWTKTFMKIWLAGVILFGLPIFVVSVRDRFTGSHFMTGDAWTGIIVFPAMILWGFLLPRIGRFLGRGDEPFLLEFVQRTLAARVEISDSQRS